MRYEVILEKGDYALVVRGTNLDEYAVVHYLDKENGCWGATTSYWNFGYHGNQAECLALAIDCFRARTEENYISKYRMEELASKAIDGLIEDDADEASYYFIEEMEMEDFELDFFGLDENGYRKEYE